MAEACEHLRRVVADLDARGLERLALWQPHRNDLTYTAYLAPDVEPEMLATRSPDHLFTGGATGCYPFPHRHVGCHCTEGAYHVVILASRRPR